MSRIGKLSILIPLSVEAAIGDGSISIKGPKGELGLTIAPEIKVDLKEIDDKAKGKEIVVSVAKETKKSRALWGLFRVLILNMVKGVTDGFEKKLEIEGIGYRANIEGGKLVLNLGLSHPVLIEAPKGIIFSVEKNVITVSGIDKQLVGQVSAIIRDKRKPEPYKGKGIHYLGETIRRKAGKKATAAE